MGYSGNFNEGDNKENVGLIIFILVVGFLCIILMFAGAAAFSMQSSVRRFEETLTARVETRAAKQTATAGYFFSLSGFDQFPFVVLDEKFDDNKNSWSIGRSTSEYAAESTLINHGVYHVEVEANKGFVSWRYPVIGNVDDFYLEVDLEKVEGNLDAEYGVVFRVAGGDFYTFYLYGNDRYRISLSYDDEWTTLKSGHFTDLKEGMNTLKVVAHGDHFFFFINGRYLAEIEDDQIPSGKVGIYYGMDYMGDQGVFEFDNLLLRATTSDLPTANASWTPEIVSLDSADGISDYFDPDAYQEVVLYDTFENNNSSWNLGNLNTGWGIINSGISDGALLVEAQADQGFIHDFIPYLLIQNLRDFYFSVDVKLPEDSGGEIGVVFRSDILNYYLFSLNNAGEFEIWIRNNGDWEYLEGGLIPEVGINPTYIYKITIVADEDQFYFFLDDKYVSQFQDARLPFGKIGLSIELQDSGEGAFWFDNFDIRRP